MARYAHEARQKIRELRAQGYTYTEIQATLGQKIPKGTLSYICKTVVMPSAYSAKLKELNQKHLEGSRKKALLINANAQKKIIEEIYMQAEKIVPDRLTNTLAKIALAMLYLGEGSKRTSYRGLSLGSSDPKIIKTYIDLLDLCYDIPLDQLKARVQYRADQDIFYLQTYWSKVTGLPLTHFYKTSPDMRTIGKPTRKADYRGVCVISCGGTKIQLELQAIADILCNRLSSSFSRLE